MPDDATFKIAASEPMPEGEYGRDWLEGLLSDLADDGLVEVERRDGGVVARLRK